MPVTYIHDDDVELLCSPNVGALFRLRSASPLDDPLLPEELRENYLSSDEAKLTNVGEACVRDRWGAEMSLNDQLYRPFGISHFNSVAEFDQFEPSHYVPPGTRARLVQIAGVAATCFDFPSRSSECFSGDGALLYARSGEAVAGRYINVLVAVEVLQHQTQDLVPPYAVQGPTPEAGCRAGFFESANIACPDTPTASDRELEDLLLRPDDVLGDWGTKPLAFEPATCGTVIGTFDEYGGRAKQLLTSSDGKLQIIEEIVRTEPGSSSSSLEVLRENATICKNQVGILIGAGLPDPQEAFVGDDGFMFSMLHPKLGTKMKVVVFRRGDLVGVLHEVARLDAELDEPLLDAAVQSALQRIDRAQAP